MPAEQLTTIPWRENRDYPEMSRLFEEISFDEVIAGFLKSTNLEHVFNDLNFADQEDCEEAIGIIRDLVSYYYMKANIDEADKNPDVGISATRKDINARAHKWTDQYSGLISPDFAADISRSYGNDGIEGFFKSISEECGGFTQVGLDKITGRIHGLSGQLPVDMFVVPMYYLTMLYVLLMKRFDYRASSGLIADPILRTDLRSHDRDWLTFMMVLNGYLLNEYRNLSGTQHSHPPSCPVESVLMGEGNNEKLVGFAKAIMRLSLGRKPDFSQMLEQDFVTSEAKNLMLKHGKDVDKTDAEKLIAEVRNLGQRLFVHTHLITQAVGNGYGKVGLSYPPGMYLNPETKNAVDVGSGKFAWFANAAAKAFPEVHFSAFDKDFPDERKNLGLSNGLPNVDLHRFELNDVDGLVRKINSRCGFVMCSNILHKLNDPEEFLDRIARDVASDVIYIVAPAFSDPGEGIVNPESLAILLRQDTTENPQNIRSFEDNMDMFKRVMTRRGFEWAGFSRLGKGKGENDIGVPRWAWVFKRKKS